MIITYIAQQEPQLLKDFITSSTQTFPKNTFLFREFNNFNLYDKCVNYEQYVLKNNLNKVK